MHTVTTCTIQDFFPGAGFLNEIGEIQKALAGESDGVYYLSGGLQWWFGRPRASFNHTELLKRFTQISPKLQSRFLNAIYDLAVGTPGKQIELDVRWAKQKWRKIVITANTTAFSFCFKDADEEPARS